MQSMPNVVPHDEVGSPANDYEPHIEPDRAFRAGMVEATRIAEERYRALLLRCGVLEAERDELLARIASLQAECATATHPVSVDR